MKDIDEIDKNDGIELLPCVPMENLIAELERRRPCKECVSWQHNSTPCTSCFWKGLWNMGEALHTDNFKPVKGGR